MAQRTGQRISSSDLIPTSTELAGSRDLRSLRDSADWIRSRSRMQIASSKLSRTVYSPGPIYGSGSCHRLRTINVCSLEQICIASRSHAQTPLDAVRKAIATPGPQLWSNHAHTPSSIISRISLSKKPVI